MEQVILDHCDCDFRILNQYNDNDELKNLLPTVLLSEGGTKNDLIPLFGLFPNFDKIGKNVQSNRSGYFFSLVPWRLGDPKKSVHYSTLIDRNFEGIYIKKYDHDEIHLLNYQNGVINVAKSYYKGSLIWTRNYYKGKIEYTEKYFYRRIGMVRKQYYQEEKKIRAEYWNLEGTLLYLKTYRDGNRETYEEWDKKGNLVFSKKYTKNTKFSFFNDKWEDIIL